MRRALLGCAIFAVLVSPLMEVVTKLPLCSELNPEAFFYGRFVAGIQLHSRHRYPVVEERMN